jgi:hypothetical protein
MMTCPNGKVKSVIFKSTINPKNNNPKATINVGIIPGIMALYRREFILQIILSPLYSK